MDAVEFLQPHIDSRKLMEHYGFESMTDGDVIRSCCKLHDGSDPSAFVMNTENGYWYCHTGDCGGGDAYTLVQRMEECSFPESIQWLADFFGVDLSGIDVSARKEKSDQEIKRWIYAIKSRRTEEYKEYVVPGEFKRVTKFRSFTRETLEKFGLIYVDGIQAEKRDGGTFTMRERLGFPIVLHDKQIGMSYRAMSSKELIKWLHQPADIRTREILYNYDEAIGAERIAVVEGIPDTWAYSEIGVIAVGTFGAHLTEQQYRLLIKSGADIVLSYDGDDAGRTAARDAYYKLRNVANVEVVHFEDGEDPENITREELLRRYENRTKQYKA